MKRAPLVGGWLESWGGASDDEAEANSMSAFVRSTNQADACGPNYLASVRNVNGGLERQRQCNRLVNTNILNTIIRRLLLRHYTCGRAPAIAMNY